ncbi:GNAT family N-acetyltransferase [Clostridium sp. KNHs214]|uniref:GNAT family N-acetyltransferase n=1 Tax=Clostridium sp. KNHs214 TaxID=1540257 RepID=UPI000550EF31|nr:GNAT family N-acetyltransferase [Clostridium sp. KNHs214]
MKFKFVPMNLEYAKEMIDNWKYNGEYHIYDYINEEEFLLCKETWGVGRFAVLNEQDKLLGELTIEFFTEEDESSEDDGYVEYSIVRNNCENIYEMWIGWGLKPELCGKGLGVEFVSECINFAVREYDYKGEYVRCGVAAFNKRAIKVYEKLNFKTFHICEGEIANKKYKILQMQKSIK